MSCCVSSECTCQVRYFVISTKESTLIKGPATGCGIKRWEDQSFSSFFLWNHLSLGMVLS